MADPTPPTVTTPVESPAPPPTMREIVDDAARDFAQASMGKFHELDNPLQISTIGSKFETLGAPLRDALTQKSLESMMHGVFGTAFGTADTASNLHDAGNVLVNLGGIALLSDVTRRLTHKVTDQMAGSMDPADQQQVIAQRIADKTNPTFGYSDCKEVGTTLAGSGISASLCGGIGIANPFHGLAGASAGISIKSRF